MSFTPQQRIRILHVDDDPSLTDLAKTFLERENDRFTIETATSATEGLERISDSPPHCVVSDYNMPGMDGLEFLEAVRAEYPDLPFILYTGKGSEAVASDAIAADVTDYLQKGTGSEQYELLANRIQNAVHARSEAQRADGQEELMRLTELAGDTGGFATDVETGSVILTDGAKRIMDVPDDAQPTIETGIERFHPEDRAEIRRTVERTIGTGEQQRGTWRYQLPDGEHRLLDVTLTLASANGDPTTLRGAIHDVTDRRKRQRDLERIETLFEHAHDTLFLVDVDERFAIERVNPAIEDATGVPATEIQGQTPKELFGEQQGAAVEARYRECIERRELLEYDEQLSFGGEPTHWETKIAPVVIDGTVEYIAGSTRDVTAQKDRQEELDAERRFIQQTLDSLEDLFYVTDEDGHLRRWNDCVPEVTGYTDSELAGMQILDQFPEDERDRVRDARETTLTAGAATVETVLRTADGTRIPYEFSGGRLTDEEGTTTGLVGTGRDITTRRKTEARVDWHQAIIRDMQEGVYVIDADYEFQFVNYRAEDVEGLSEQNWTGRQLSYLAETGTLTPSEIESVRNGVDRLVDGEAGQVSIEVEPDKPDSTEVAELRLEPLDGNTDENLVLVTTRDVTEHKRREQEILELKRQYQTLAENLPNGAVFLFDTDLRYVRARGAELEAVGMTPDEIEGATPHEVLPEETADELAQYFTDALDGNSHTFTQTYGDETYRNRIVPVQTDDGEITYGMALSQNVTEQTERRRKRERQNERLEEFTSVISHDLRSPLTVANGHLELAQETCESDRIARARDAIDRSQALIDHLLTLAREGNQIDDTEWIALADVARSSWQTVDTAQTTLDANASRAVEADRKRLRQLFENLYRNAVEKCGDDVSVSVGAMDDGFYVADTGPGIPESDRDEIFEARYSATEDGTGFGLRIVGQIAEAHGWDVTVTESRAGGARFEMTGVEFAEQ